MKQWIAILAAALVLPSGVLRAQDARIPPTHNATPSQVMLTGHVLSPAGAPIHPALITVGTKSVPVDSSGAFAVALAPGEYDVLASAPQHTPSTIKVHARFGTDLTITLIPEVKVTVSVKEAATEDGPSQVYSADELPTARPGLPGVPFSVPGAPVETASGGVKAPQYFAPGVAGDHGEPIAQYIHIGDYLLPNNLPANAHGNGYADPNLLIPSAVSSVETDPGAFDVRHGNNAVDLAVAYGLRARLEPEIQFTGDPRNYNVVTTWSPRDKARDTWLGVELAGGNGLLRLPEHRKQYKLNAQHAFTRGHHQVTIFGAAYFGDSRLPGLVPIDLSLPDDTFDPRQSDRTNTELLAINDSWGISDSEALQMSGFFRTYGLSLSSNFGDGLIRQSEFRTVTGGNVAYHRQLQKVSFHAGLDLRRDAPRDAALEHADDAGIFHSVTRNDFSIGDVAPYAAIDGTVAKYFGYSLGLRRDEIWFNNVDRLNASNSYESISGMTSPRATLSFHVPRALVPSFALSYGEAFHTNDPRIAVAAPRSTPVSTARAYQFVISKDVAGTELRIALARVSSSEEFAKLDADTGLQEDVGPSLVRSLTVSARRRFRGSYVQASFARAMAINPLTGVDVPEAPRLIWNISGGSDRLPFKLRASGEVEYVGKKPLGDRFTAVPVREIRGSLTRPIASARLDAAFHFCLASGYTGQTLETLQLPPEIMASERIVGVRNASYAGIGLTYHFGHARSTR